MEAGPGGARVGKGSGVKGSLAGIGGAVSRSAGEVDAVFWFIAAVAAFFFLLTQGLLIGFALRYRRRRGEAEAETPYITGNRALETVWIVIPTAVVVAIFAYGWVAYRNITAPLPGALEVSVTGKQWLWEFRYPDGRTAINEVRVPVGRPVKFLMTSPDVIHSFYLPDFRLKQDVVPGRYTTLYLTADRPGEYVIHCAEYCGAGHSTMDAKLVAMPEAEYAKWAAGALAEDREAVPPAQRGEELVERSGCLACHAVEGAEKVGPNFGGIFGRKTALEDGRTVVADEEYLRESIVDPNAKVAKGYPPVMPTFRESLSAEEVADVVAYLKTL